MTYNDPGCAYCPSTVRACRHGESEARGPGFCPSKVDQNGLAAAWQPYADPGVRRIAQASALVESEGYCRWTRVEEICQFARRLGYRKIGIATCISFVDLARTLSGILESHGFEVASVACKNGGIAKEAIGVRDDQKIRPGGHESMCNPIAQAELLDRAGCELNVVLGLCVGHDSLFFRHSKGLATTLVAKDRVLGHNPVAALQLADTYYQRVWGTERPATPPSKPAEGRRPRSTSTEVSPPPGGAGGGR
jgi:uncharacterized metal-binding protein